MIQVNLRFSEEQISEIDALAKSRNLDRAPFVRGVVEAMLNDQKDLDQLKHRLAELERKLDEHHEESRSFSAAILLAVATLSAQTEPLGKDASGAPLPDERLMPDQARRWLARKGFDFSKKPEAAS